MKVSRILIALTLSLFVITGKTQNSRLTGYVKSGDLILVNAEVFISGSGKVCFSDSAGRYSLNDLNSGTYTVNAALAGYLTQSQIVSINDPTETKLSFDLPLNAKTLAEVVITHSLLLNYKPADPVPTEVYTKAFFKTNPAPSLFESMQTINGVRPQVNCNICNTGNIQINGLNGPYTMVLIDGMPIVSGLATVYGLSGIPQSLIERIEIVKGPAPARYTPEAVGGMINIITKKPQAAPLVAADIFSSSWADFNIDLGVNYKTGKKSQGILGVNYFNYENPIDYNKDGFTDVTLQDRISLFNKWQLERKDNRLFTLAGRYVYEDRWGGDMRWNRKFRGGDSIYGESIYTNRWEVMGTYQLPLKEIIYLQLSSNGHYQDSYYGTGAYMASQWVHFGQVTWEKSVQQHFISGGISYRYTWYDDNLSGIPLYDSTKTVNAAPFIQHLPGLFLQNEIRFNETQTLLVGGRYDYHQIYGSVFSPRINYKIASRNQKNTLRISGGNGFRVANVFTEDISSLTGSRRVLFRDELKPERSWNGNINFMRKFFPGQQTVLSLDFTTFYSYFTNRIIPDFDTDPDDVIFGNLDGSSVSKGISFNIDVVSGKGLKLMTGGTLMDVSYTHKGQTKRQLLTERYSATWSMSYTFPKTDLSVDYTGNVFGPMNLPVLGPLDNRPAESPVWSLQNLQITKRFKRYLELYGGVKNILNYTLPTNTIARPFDPFDRNVQFDSKGQAIATPDNPNALTFDSFYAYAPNQGRRPYLGLRFTF